MDLGLSRITQLVRRWYPKLPWKAIHIAGTNGKGSTSAFLSGLLRRSGVQVGRFNSPHLLERHDCITINDKPIQKDFFLQIEDEVKQYSDKNDIQATSFELLTAIAYTAFAISKVEFGVIECGLGGARDATNVLLPEEVACSVITSIDLDHAEVIGPTIEDIAQEKAGIIKHGVPVVFDYGKYPKVREIIRRRADQVGTRTYFMRDFALSIGKGLKNVQPDSVERQKGPKDLNLPGHQLRNLAIAYDAYLFVRSRNPKALKYISPDEALHVAREVKQTWRGRMELLSIEDFAGRKSKIMLDGAHNPAAATLLQKHVTEYTKRLNNVTSGKRPRVTWVIAMSSSKDIETLLEKLLMPNDRVVLTQFGPVDGMPWVAPASLKQLQDLSRQFIVNQDDCMAILTPGEALRKAAQVTPEKELIVVAGSLYLIADLLRIPTIGGDLVAMEASNISTAETMAMFERMKFPVEGDPNMSGTESTSTDDKPLRISRPLSRPRWDTTS